MVERTGTDNTTMQQAAVELASSVDAMFSPNDNTVATGMASLGQVAADAGIPYYVGADSMVQTGGFATVGIDYEELGRETARMTIDVLNGKSPADMPVKVFKDNLNIYVNEELLNKLSENGKTKVATPRRSFRQGKSENGHFLRIKKQVILAAKRLNIPDDTLVSCLEQENHLSQKARLIEVHRNRNT